MKSVFSNVARFVNNNLISPLSAAVKQVALGFVKQAPELGASVSAPALKVGIGAPAVS